MPPRRLNRRQQSAGLKHGWRSGLEEQLAAQLRAHGLDPEEFFESLVIRYKKPETPSRYTPDFPLPNGIIVESKGRFVTADRKKHLLVKAQHPDLDIRFVFSNSRSRISKQSQTTYADWCRHKGFLFADKYIPEAWLLEPPNKRSLAAIARILKEKR